MRSLLLLIFILFLAGACVTKKAETTSGSINSEAPFLWETAFPKNIYVSTDFSTAAEQTKIDEMFTAWEVALNNYDFFNNAGTQPELTTGLSSTSQLRDNKFVIYKASDWPYPEYPSALAITQIFAVRYNVGKSNEYAAIQEADVIMNYENFQFDTGGFDYDFRTVLLHELGHFLGLQHKPTSYNRNNTVMYPSIYSYETKQAPLTVDKQDIASKYGITLPLTAGGSAITGNKQVYTRSPNDPGEMMKMVLELRADGECIHHVDGAVIGRHRMMRETRGAF